MYLYFNSDGVLKEIINDSALRQGSTNVNKVYAYFENENIVNSTFKQDNWETVRYETSQETSQIPYNENRKLLFFKYFTSYLFHCYTYTSTDLSVSGNHKLTIIGIIDASTQAAEGRVYYNIEESDIIVDSDITLAQFDYLIDYVGTFQGQINTKADKTYVDSENDAQDVLITNNTNNTIKSVLDSVVDGVFTTTLTKENDTTLSSLVDLKNTFYVKSLVYSKKEADNKFLTSAELNNYLTIASASETYETKVDSASKLDEAKAYTDTNVATLNEKNTTQDTAITNAQDKADSAYTLASGKTTGYTFDTYLAMKTALASATNSVYKVGDSLFIKETNMPDYWVSKVNSVSSGDYGYYEVDILESDMQEYQKITDNTLTTTSKTIPGSINELNSLKAPVSTTQTKTDNTLTTTNKTIAGGINENKASIDTLSDEVISNVGKLQQIDLVGTLAGGVITFTTSDTYTLKENCTYELDLHFNVAGNIDLDNTMLCVINGTTINLQNILNNSGTMKVRDMLQVQKYTNAVGYRWIFNAVYNTVNSAGFFGIPATIVKSDIMPMSDEQLLDIVGGVAPNTYENGQLIYINSVGAGNGYKIGHTYKLVFDYASDTFTTVDVSLTQDLNASEVKYDNSTSGLTATTTQTAIDELNTKIETASGNIYGVKFYGSNTTGVRTDSAVGLSVNAGVDSEVVVNDFDKIVEELNLFEKISDVDLSGNTNYFIKVKKHYISITKGTDTTGDYVWFRFSMTNHSGFEVPYCFLREDGTIREYCYLSAYKGCYDDNQNICSAPTIITHDTTNDIYTAKYTLATRNRNGCNNDMDVMETKAEANGYTLETYAEYTMFADLMFIIEGVRDSQIMNYGVMNPSRIDPVARSFNSHTETTSTVIPASTAFVIYCEGDRTSYYKVGDVIEAVSEADGFYYGGNRIITGSTYDSTNNYTTITCGKNATDDAGWTWTTNTYVQAIENIGKTDNVLASIGSETSRTSGYNHFKEYGREDSYGTIWENCAGSFRNGLDLYLTKDYTQFKNTYRVITNTKYEKVISGFASSSTEGYTKDRTYYKGVGITTELGGSSGTYYADYYWIGSSLGTDYSATMYVGARAGAGSNCGTSTLTVRSRLGDAWWDSGCRLSATLRLGGWW